MDETLLHRRQQEILREFKRKNETPENSFLVKSKADRPYNVELYENMQQVDPRSARSE